MRMSAKWLVLSVLVAGCGGTTRGRQGARAGGADPGAVAAAREGARWEAARVEGAAPLSQGLTLIAARGEVRVTTASGETVAKPGQVLMGVTRVRAAQGAVLTLGAPAAPLGKLWLASGAEVRVGERTGKPVVGLIAGQVRVSLFGPGDDVLLAREGAHVAARMVAAQPEAADWALELEAEPAPASVGALVARAPGGKPVELSLAALSVDARRAGDQVETEVEHVFDNASDETLEGTFRFPLPDGASLTGLAMEIDGRMMQGELVERQQARKIFDEIVDQMQDPALLEWEQGQELKLRVFPIEAHKQKRIVLRYLTPLRPAQGGHRWVYSAAGRIASAKSQAIGQVTVRFDGKLVASSRGALPGADIVVDLPAREVAGVYREERPEGTYVSARVTPDWSRVPATGRTARPLVIVVDSSRSALEERGMTEEAVRSLLEALRPGEQVALTACDLGCRDYLPAPVAAGADMVAGASRWVAGLSYDGASDLGGAFEHVAALRARWGGAALDVIYVGDGLPTWGDTEAAALAEHGAHAVGTGALHALVVGKGGSVELMRGLSGARGGRAMRPGSGLDVRKFALSVLSGRGGPRLVGAHIVAPTGSVVYPARATTLFPGDELGVVVFTPRGTAAPKQLVLSGGAGEAQLSQVVLLGAAQPAKYVARRWGAERVAELEATGAEDAEVVKASLAFGVLSRKTAFLVLESEEAYAKYQIERKQKELAEADGPRVTGQDLESSDDEDASLSPNNIQPGDPEVRVPAPRDARAVVVVFPFGETKLATWDEEAQAWMVRFLIDKDTPDGEYFVTVRVTHADGTVETMKLGYHVDTVAPDMKITVERTPKGNYRIRAVQQIPDLSRAQVLTDARRVEVRLPDGEEMQLGGFELGEFRGLWRPRAGVSGTVMLTVIVTDRALNQRVYQVPVEVK